MTVLAIEDDRKIAAVVARSLGVEGFDVDVALDGLDGLDGREGHGGRLHLIVLDIALPKGFLVCADLRAAGNWTPILMLTDKDGDLDEAEALRPAPTTISRSRSQSRC